MDLKPKNIHFKERIEGHLSRQNFMHHIEFNLSSIKPGYTEGEMKLKSIHLQQDGFAHGGVIATIADIAAGFAAYTLVGADDHVVTGEIKVSFFKTIKAEPTLCTVLRPSKGYNSPCPSVERG